MCGKLYHGDRFSFILLDDKKLGSGGNGHVYEAKIIDSQESQSCAVKFLRWPEDMNEKDRNERYERFVQETDFLEKNASIKGIIPILDKHLPKIRSKEDEAWYLMPKARKYDFTEHRPLAQILTDMIDLAKTLQTLHQSKLAHRDIKPENLLYYQERLCLCDFGLLWGYGEERITKRIERVGPYRILPPELDPVRPWRDLNYTYSDVYLFAKNLWMLLKQNKYGFKGPYQRGNNRLYLQRENFNVPTLEPIHNLLEKATEEEINDRIDIGMCIKLLEAQQEILFYDDSPDQIWKKRLAQYIYSENTKRITEQNQPNAKEYTEAKVITELIEEVLATSVVHIKTIYSKEPILISIDTFDIVSSADNEFVIRIDKGSVLIHLKIAKLVYSISNGAILLVLENPQRANPDEVEFSGVFTQKSQGPVLPITFRLTKNDTIIFEKP